MWEIFKHPTLLYPTNADVPTRLQFWFIIIEAFVGKTALQRCFADKEFQKRLYPTTGGHV